MRIGQRTGSDKSELEVLKRGEKLLKQDGVLHLPENDQEALD